MEVMALLANCGLRSCRLLLLIPIRRQHQILTHFTNGAVRYRYRFAFADLRDSRCILTYEIR